MRVATLALMTLLASACGAETEEPACCAIEPRHLCRADLLGGGATEEELSVILGPDRVVCPSDRLSAERIATLAPILAQSAACRTTGDSGRLSPLGDGLCETTGMSDPEP